MSSTQSAVLLLQDGTIFHGKSFGFKGTATGEICFNTGMTGYQEVFTDPSYYGQIIIMNAAHIGNYGTKPVDVESKTVKVSGIIARNLADKFSRPQADRSLEQYLIDNQVVAIHGIDTRALVTHVRQCGAMNCIISSDTSDIDSLQQTLAAVPSMEGLNLSSFVSTTQAYELGNTTSTKRIAVLDFGVKQHILDSMTQRGAYLKVFPQDVRFEDIQAFQPEAYFISNGPGDPAAMPEAIELVKKIMDTNKPVFGICLGHQLISLASGAKTYKMHHGHRGLNHPVLNLKTMRSEISTQNHGFAVDRASIEAIPELEITHVNLNDDSLEGIARKDKPVFSVQYHPEATPGPHDSRYLFDDFIAMIEA